MPPDLDSIFASMRRHGVKSYRLPDGSEIQLDAQPGKNYADYSTDPTPAQPGFRTLAEAEEWIQQQKSEASPALSGPEDDDLYAASGLRPNVRMSTE